MTKATKLAIILVSAGLTVGCASKGDLEKVQQDVAALKSEVASVKSTAEEALSAAQQAESTAKAADARSRQTAADVDAKLNAGFRKHMLK
ncbi:murein lipoprotein [Gammaproteobacteria bacterium]|nr:murein lipoprotein [Gammaproteobacteria bacterium]